MRRFRDRFFFTCTSKWLTDKFFHLRRRYERARYREKGELRSNETCPNSTFFLLTLNSMVFFSIFIVLRMTWIINLQWDSFNTLCSSLVSLTFSFSFFRDLWKSQERCFTYRFKTPCSLLSFFIICIYIYIYIMSFASFQLYRQYLFTLFFCYVSRRKKFRMSVARNENSQLFCIVCFSQSSFIFAFLLILEICMPIHIHLSHSISSLSCLLPTVHCFRMPYKKKER